MVKQVSDRTKLIDQMVEEVSLYLDKRELEMLQRVLKNNEGREFEVLQELMGYTYREKPVSVRQFFHDEKYMGLEGEIFPVLLDDLEEMFTGDYIEAVFTGGIGYGKSTIAELSMCRMLYEVSCFRNPQRAFGLMSGSVITFINVSVNKENAKKVVFQGIKSKLINSPYFSEQFPPSQEYVSELRFPNNVWIFPVASTETGILGYDVYGGTMDEVNFMPVIEDSKRAPEEGVYDQAKTLYDALIRRMRSRFMEQGNLPGILIQVSSSKYPEDFTERKIEEAKDNPTIFARRYAQWEPLPDSRFSGRKFRLALGDQSERPRILKDSQEPKETERVIEVPEEYRGDFEKDIDGAIRDLAGQPVLTVRPFIRNRVKVFEAMDKGEEYGLEHPYTKSVTTLRDGATFNTDKLIIPRLRKKMENAEDAGERAEYEELYEEERSRPRYIHVDLAATNQAGIAVGHVRGEKTVTRRNMDGGEYQMSMPIIAMDLMLAIRAPRGDEIDISEVRSIIYELRSYGYRISKISFDQYQSRESMQQLNKSGMNAEYLSVVSSMEPYNALREAVMDDRWIAYYHDVAYEEIIRLEKSEKDDKVDHPPGGSKDVADAIAGVCFHCVDKSSGVTAPPPSLGALEGDEYDKRSDEDKELDIPIVR